MKTVRFLPVLIAAVLSWAPASAHTLTTVPMQGAMIHVGFEYHAAHSALHVHVDEGVPELVAVTQMDDHSDFVETDPWFADLGRTQAGLAFNRQYGFVIGSGSDPLPPGTGIRIRQLASTSGLRAYQYRATDPKAWAPMFGTAGSADHLDWNLVMFHPAYAAPVGSGPHEAQYEATMMNTADGTPVPGVGPVRFTLSWNVRGQAEPELEIAQRLVLTWPSAATGYRVEAADSVGGPWTPVAQAPVVIDGRLTVLVAPGPGHRFFRLQPVTQP